MKTKATMKRIFIIYPMGTSFPAISCVTPTKNRISRKGSCYLKENAIHFISKVDQAMIGAEGELFNQNQEKKLLNNSSQKKCFD
jgi:hypothetical protein